MLLCYVRRSTVQLGWWCICRPHCIDMKKGNVEKDCVKPKFYFIVSIFSLPWSWCRCNNDRGTWINIIKTCASRKSGEKVENVFFFTKEWWILIELFYCKFSTNNCICVLYFNHIFKTKYFICIHWLWIRCNIFCVQHLPEDVQKMWPV